MVADTKKDSKTEMVAGASQMVRLRARRDCMDHAGNVHKAGAEFETTAEHANQITMPIRGHMSFFGERSPQAAEYHDLTRAERL